MRVLGLFSDNQNPICNSIWW